MNFKYSFTNDMSFPKGNKWFAKEKEYLTYAFAPESQIPLDMTNVFRNAFARWSQTTRVLNFSETTSYDNATLRLDSTILITSMGLMMLWWVTRLSNLVRM
jgi:hypothetical protein